MDCGLYQERDLRGRNWESFPIAPQSIDAVLSIHAHLDHCGLLPKLVKEGFNGKIFCFIYEVARLVLPGANFDKVEFFELCVQNQGYRVEAFTNFQDTIHWLSNSTASPIRQRTPSEKKGGKR